MANSKKNIVVIGGGTGTSVVLSGLKDNKDLNLSAVVVVSDSGGSTGRLRDEFGFLPVGDLRQCLASLAEGKMQDEVRKILLYRFNKGEGLEGHNLGNLILTALEDLYPSPGKAIDVASKIFRIDGSVLPITEDSTDLIITYDGGEKRTGESNLDDSKNGGKKISKISFSQNSNIYPPAEKAIINAGVIIMGPGDLYGSLLPNTLVSGFEEALKKNKKKGGKFVYVLNLMTHFSQTHQMTGLDHLNEVIKYCKRTPDYVIINKQKTPTQIRKIYEKNKEFQVIDDLDSQITKESQLIRENLLSQVTEKQSKSDKVSRSLLRHNKKKLAKIIEKIVYS